MRATLPQRRQVLHLIGVERSNARSTARSLSVITFSRAMSVPVVLQHGNLSLARNPDTSNDAFNLLIAIRPSEDGIPQTRQIHMAQRKPGRFQFARHLSKGR